MWGSTNELMIFPIIDLIRKELRNIVQNEGLESMSGGSTTNILLKNDSTTKNITYDSQLLARLESNDFDLELEKNDPSKPNMLTGVIISFGEDLKEIISLIRNNNKLTNVKIAIVIREKLANSYPNPYNMSGSDFTQYVLNKRAYMYYDGIANDPTSTPDVVADAEDKKVLYNTKNVQLRNVYGISSDQDLPYETLVTYMPNPLGMDRYDYTTYLNCKWVYDSDCVHPDATDAVRAAMTPIAEALRVKYFIAEDTETYDTLSPYLPNPLHMQDSDLSTYIDNKEKWLSLDPSDPVQAGQMAMLEQANKALRDKYYLVDSQDTYSVSDLKSYLPIDATLYKETVLLKILISLSYNTEGKLTKVKSETQEA